MRTIEPDTSLRNSSGPVLRMKLETGHARLAVLKNGVEVPAEIVYLSPRFKAAAPLAAALECAMADTSLGAHVAADAIRRTSVDGVLAAGDLT